MKQLLTFLLILVLFTPGLRGQELLLGILPLQENKITYAGEEKVPGATAEKLHDKARGWFAATDKVSKDVIASDTREQINGSGKYEIRAKGVGLVGYNMDVLYTITLKFREGAYSYLFTDFIGQSKGKFGLIEDPLENWNSEYTEEDKRAKKNAKVYPQVNAGMTGIIDGLKNTLSTAN